MLFVYKPQQSTLKPKGDYIFINNNKLFIEIADTAEKRTLGLSNRPSLAEDSGLLFIFEKPGYYQFWMKDMSFSIDIAWIDENKNIIHIENDVSPKDFPKTYVSLSHALYVLETNSGYFEKNKIKIGDKIKF